MDARINLDKPQLGVGVEPFDMVLRSQVWQQVSTVYPYAHSPQVL